jgi:hypothetical protein
MTPSGTLRFVGPGSRLDVEGTALLDVGAMTIDVEGPFGTSGGARLRMQQAPGMLTVDGTATFGGGGTAGLLTAGVLTLRSDLIQTGQVESFAASGQHVTNFVTEGTQTITFANPGTGAGTSHFHHFNVLQAAGSSVALASDAYATGILDAGQPWPLFFTAALDRRLVSHGARVSNVRFDRVRWTLGGAETVSLLQAITFGVMEPTVPQFEIRRAGGALTVDGITFNTTPTPATTGRYLRLEDSAPADASTLQVTVLTPAPAYHGGFVETVGGAQLLGWLPSAPAPVIAWTGGGGDTFWSNTANWNLGRLPQVTDSVVIDLPGAYTVTMNSAATVRWLQVGGQGTPTFLVQGGATLQADTIAVFLAGSTLTMTGGTMRGGPILLLGTFNWNGGTMAGTEDTFVAAGATATIGTTASGILDDRTLAIDGTARFDGFALGTANAGAISVLTSGVLEFRQPVSWFVSGTPGLFNGGTVRKLASAGTVRFDWPVQSIGTIDVESGLLDLRGRLDHDAGQLVIRSGGTLSTGGHSEILGAVDVQAGGTFSLNAIGVGDKEHFLRPASSVTGAGTVDVNGATLVDIQGAFDVGALQLSNATLAINGADTAFVGGGAYSGGGFLIGTGVLGIRGAFSSTGGNPNGSGTISVLSGGTFTLNSPLRGWRLDVAGTLVWGDWFLSMEQDPVSLQHASINILPGGLLDIQHTDTGTAWRIFANTNNPMVNAGTLRKLTGPLTTQISMPLTNTGTVNVTAGGLFFQFGCVNTGTITGNVTGTGCTPP